jgi:diguanylate cyclase (GGDEF)-like protein
MSGEFSGPGGRAFLLRTVIPIATVAMLIIIAAGALLRWATLEADFVAVQRQHSLVTLIISRLQSGIAHDQESVTVWDDAVEAVRGEKPQEWISTNLGEWMHTYFGHDAAYVLDPDGNPTYSYPDDAASPGFDALRAAVAPLAARLEDSLRAGDTEGLSERVLSLGVADITRVSDHPAVVSIKPIVSDSGEIQQKAGEEYLHVAVRHLDGSFLQELRDAYLLGGVRFSWTNDKQDFEAASALTSRQGETVGFLIWQPYLPGTAVMHQIGPVFLTVAVVALCALFIFIIILRKRSLRLIQSEATVRHLAHHDLLTGLPNRASFNDRLDATLIASRGSGEEVAVLYLDLDRFKAVNDTFGHPAGDELLRAFADRLKRLTRENDTVARIGGDEFMILVRQVTSGNPVEGVCQRLIEAARRPFEIAGTQAFVGVSVGAAISPRDGFDRVELMRRADVALYHSKAAGRSNYGIYSSDMDRSTNERRDLERDLRNALETEDELQVYYQPLMSVAENAITGLEALIRWHHPARGLLSPDRFIPLAEECGLIEKVGERVLRDACIAASRWPIQTIAVNVSPVELRSPSYAIRVANILLASGLSPRRLELELTESAFLDKSGECKRNIDELRAMGVRIALDDFGTGFSSLARLHEMEVDRIKIDRSFVHGFGNANGDEAIVQAIVDLARAKGLKTTAEGVETASQQELLESIGCDELQGFLFSKPLSALEIEKLWGADRRTLKDRAS